MSDDRPVATLSTVFSPSQRVVGRVVGDGYVLVPLARRGEDLDAVFDLNRTAAFVWQHLDGRRDGYAVVAALVARFEVEEDEAATDYLALMSELVALNMVHGRVVAGATE